MIALALSLLLAAPPAPRALSLADALGLAAKRNPEVRAAEAEAERVHDVDRQALSFFFPTVEARATMQWNDRRLAFSAGPTTFVLQPWWTANWQVVATENLALYGPAIPLLRQANAAQRAASAVTAQTREEISFAAARAYYAALEADALVAVAEEAKSSAAELLRQTEGKKSAGRATEADVLRAKLRVSETAQAADQTHRGADEAHAMLADVLGDAGPFALARPPRPATPAGSEDPPESSLAHRADVAAASEAVTGADLAKTAAARQFLPSLSVSGVYSGYATSDGDLFGQLPTRYSVLGVASIPIFDGNLKYWQLREKRAALAEAHAREEAARTAASADLRRAKSRLAAARDAETLSHERLTLAERTRELVSGSYQLGAATQLEILDADAARSAAQRDAAQAELEVDVAILDLRRALGLPLLEGSAP
ncbi:MAG TPA: TolC family protein [bacterium]|nr:TolC family protein [bacterium]